MKEIGVAHLIYAPYGPAPFREFLASYRAHDAGIAHELILLLKGFSSSQSFEPFRELLGRVPHRVLEVPDGGFDIGSYLFLAQTCDYERLCFMNSSSVILRPDWLAKMQASLQQTGVGLVGATGTCESFYSSLKECFSPVPIQISGRGLRNNYRQLRNLVLAWTHFRPFPNFHLRSNAFLLKRGMLLSLRLAGMPTKDAAYRFESGREGLTAQVLMRGYQVRVIGSDGVGYSPAEARASNTFRSGDQSNLLVADNQTRAYAQADTPTRRRLERLAWGDAETKPLTPTTIDLPR